jgi:hypothetical protein
MRFVTARHQLLAIYEEHAVDGAEWAKGFNYERYYTSNELRNGFMELDETQAYKQSYDIVSGIIGQYGRESLNHMLDELKKGDTLDGAFLEVYGKELNEYIDSGAWKG